MSEIVNLPAITLIFSVGTFIIALICLYAIIKKPQEQEQKQELQINESQKSPLFWYVLNILSWIFFVVTFAKFIQRFM